MFAHKPAGALNRSHVCMIGKLLTLDDPGSYASDNATQ